MEDEVKGLKIEGEVFIMYLEDNDKPVSAYVHIVEVKEGLITFKTNRNIITLPISRIIKIKSERTDGN